MVLPILVITLREMGGVDAKKDRVTKSDLRHDEEKEKMLKTGHITLYTKIFTVTGLVS